MIIPIESCIYDSDIDRHHIFVNSNQPNEQFFLFLQISLKKYWKNFYLFSSVFKITLFL